MKKFVVLLLIISLTSMASAAIMYFEVADSEVAPGEVFTVNVKSDVAVSNFVLNVFSGNHTTTVGLVNDLFTLTNIDGQQKTGVSPADLMIFKISGGLTGTVPVGTVLYSFTATAGSAGSNSLFWSGDSNGGAGPITAVKLNGAVTQLQELSVPTVPEPMTVMLLGLGGLFLRRRKA